MKKILEDSNRIPIDLANDNPILDSRMYKVEYRNGYVSAMESNAITENIFKQVYQEDNIFVLIESIMDTRTDGTQILQQYAFIITNTKSGTKRRKIQLKDGKYASNGRMTVLHEKKSRYQGFVSSTNGRVCGQEYNFGRARIRMVD